ncbi:Ff.00g086400.m01.CDS01 [Fusarium sp. VM40]|nr:Ff.00g086400.m01.CDS01 [Fusarium sp. VM40]
MPKERIYHLHPTGWENDPEEERFRVTTLDYLTVCTYNNYALFFKLNDADKERVVEVLKAGLERTLAQARHYCGIIEKDSDGGHSFTRKKDSTVDFIVQWLDTPEDANKYPSLEDVEKTNFSAVTLGNLEAWSVPPMTYGEKPEAHPDNSPVVSAFKANFVRGGLVFNMHHHHYANDVMGWFPSWDVLNLDVSRLIKQEPPENRKINGPTPKERHPAHQVGVSLLFHLSKSKAAELKARAMPTDGTWVSTYDAFSAFIWRNLTRIRAPVFNPDPTSKLFWCEAIDMRRRMHSPKVPPRLQHNVMFAAVSLTAPVEQPTVAEVISDWTFSQLASYIRRLTDSVNQENLDETLEMVARVRDKTSLNTRIDAQPPLSILQTDHRDADITAADFGFTKPVTYRHLLDRITQGVIIVYPPRDTSPESDEGCEFAIFYEKRLAQDLIDDVEWSQYFEYRGVDAEDGSQ